MIEKNLHVIFASVPQSLCDGVIIEITFDETGRLLFMTESSKKNELLNVRKKVAVIKCSFLEKSRTFALSVRIALIQEDGRSANDFVVVFIMLHCGGKHFAAPLLRHWQWQWLLLLLLPSSVYQMKKMCEVKKKERNGRKRKEKRRAIVN